MREVAHATKQPGFPAPIFIHRATPEEAEAFFSTRAKDVRAIADPDGVLFAGFGLHRGTFAQLLGLRAIWRALHAMLRGNFVGKPTDHVAQMPGTFLVRNQEILWEHRASHAGDQPDLDAVMDALHGANRASPQRPSRSTKATLKKLEQKHLDLLTAARDLQRKGDIQAFATKTEEASKVADEIDALQLASK